MLVAEPERNPAAIVPLRRRDERHGAVRGAPQCRLQLDIDTCVPRAPRQQGMRGDLGRALVEWECPPASTERRDASVPVLQIHEPACTTGRGLACSRIVDGEMRQRQQRAGGVVGVRHPAAQGGPCPRPWSRVGERVFSIRLLREQPVPHRRLLSHRECAGRTERADRERRDPRRQVGVDRPAAILAHRLAQKTHAGIDDRAGGLAHAGQAHDHEARQRGGFQVAAACRLHLPEVRATFGDGRGSAGDARWGCASAHGDDGPARWLSAPAAHS